jgi:hypothetical protein
MKCKGLTVVRGTTISSFDVEVLDVVAGDPGEGPRILVRASGPAVDATGIGFGFSGSPVLCTGSDGVERTAGAISETVGEFGNHIVLATPIEAMLGDPVDPPPSVRSGRRLLRSARPLSAAITVSGLSSRIRASLRRAAARHSIQVLTAPGGPLAGFPVQTLRPGASASATMSTGAVSLGSLGTVAFRDGSVVWAFGHSLDGVGRRSLLLQDAYVFSVIGNPGADPDLATFKLAAAGHTVGTLTNDGLDAVVGRVGRPAPAIPLRVAARDLGTGRISDSQSYVSDERELDLPPALDEVGNLALAQATSAALRSLPPRVTSSLCLRIQVRERPRPLGFCNSYFDSDGPFLDYSRAVELTEAYSFAPLHLTSVSARLRLRRGVREAFLLRGWAPRRVHRGQRIRIRLRIQKRRAGSRLISFRFRVPRHLGLGRHVLTLTSTQPTSPGQGLEISLEDIFGGDGSGPSNDESITSLDELAGRIAAIRHRQGLRGTFRRRGGRVVMRSDTLLLRGRVQVPLRVVAAGRLRASR